jgi:hypothetical protein
MEEGIARAPCTTGRSTMIVTKIVTKASVRVPQGSVLLLLMSVVVLIGAAIFSTAPPSHALMETTPPPIGKELAVKGEVVMIEGDVQIVEDPSSGQKDTYLIVDHLYVAQVAGDEAIEFHVNENTHMDDVKIGDKVEVLASENREAVSIKKTE